jgi:parallel beta-helix repeat protein
LLAWYIIVRRAKVLRRIKAGLVSSVWVSLLFVALFGVVLNVPGVRASGTIYIRADGTIAGTIYIQTSDNVTYVFTANINDSIIVERNNIVLDGAGHTLRGSGSGNGIYLPGKMNVTIRNLQIKDFERGLRLSSFSNHNIISGNNVTANKLAGIWLGGSSDNTISGNNVTNNGDGIWLYSSSNNNSVCRNYIANNDVGIETYGSQKNSILDNAVTNNNGYGIEFDASSGNIVSGNNVRDNGVGIEPGDSPGNTISGNNVTNNGDGILLYASSYNRLAGNIMTNNNQNFGVDGYNLSHFMNYVDTSNMVNGKPLYYLVNRRDMMVPLDAGYVAIVNCTHITVQNLSLASNRQGLLLAYTTNSTITKNNVVDNHVGIWLYLSSNFNCIYGNNVTANDYGIVLGTSSKNKIYHNNFIANAQQAYSASSGYTNSWENGYPSGGNYWSNYIGTDLYSGSYQNETGSDGISDAPYTIDANNADRYPLMGMFYGFNVSWIEPGYNVELISNSSVSAFGVGFWIEHPNTRIIKFNATRETGTVGFCRICIPTALLNAPYTVLLNGTEIPCTLLPFSNSTHSYLYFNYTHSTQEVIIIPEFPSFLILPLFMIATLLAVIVYRRKHSM